MTKHGLSRSLPDPASDSTANCDILVFCNFLNAYSFDAYTCIYVYVGVCILVCACVCICT